MPEPPGAAREPEIIILCIKINCGCEDFMKYFVMIYFMNIFLQIIKLLSLVQYSFVTVKQVSASCFLSYLGNINASTQN